MGIPIRCCPFFFFVASERLSHPPTGAVCGRRFSFSAVPRPLCHSAVKLPVGFSAHHGRDQRPSTSIPAVRRAEVRWRGRGISRREKSGKAAAINFIPQPLFISLFNFSHKRPTFAFIPESGYRLSEKDRTQRHTRRNVCAPTVKSAASIRQTKNSLAKVMPPISAKPVLLCHRKRKLRCWQSTGC